MSESPQSLAPAIVTDDNPDVRAPSANTSRGIQLCTTCHAQFIISYCRNRRQLG